MDTLCSIEIGHNFRQREPYEKILQIPTMDVGGIQKINIWDKSSILEKHQWVGQNRDIMAQKDKFTQI